MKQPFFAKFLENQKSEDETQDVSQQNGAVKTGVVAGGRAPGRYQTMKYPSDNDEGGYTMKYPSDYDEFTEI